MLIFQYISTAAGVQGFPNDITSAKATILVNLCSLYCLRKEYDLAKKALQQVSNAIRLIRLLIRCCRLWYYTEHPTCLAK